MKRASQPSLEGARAYYHGGAASVYDRKRAGKSKWKVEHECLTSMLRGVQGTVLDVPVGTGRFLSLYKSLGLSAVGVDANQSMLDQARAKHPDAQLLLGDVTKLEFADCAFSTTVCVRLLHLITPAELSLVMDELFRVSSQHVIVSTYLANKPYANGRQQVHSILDLEASKPQGWWTSQSVPLLAKNGMGDYFMIQFSRGQR